MGSNFSASTTTTTTMTSMYTNNKDMRIMLSKHEKKKHNRDIKVTLIRDIVHDLNQEVCFCVESPVLKKYEVS